MFTYYTKTFPAKSNKAVIIFCGWKSHAHLYLPLAYFLKAIGFHTILYDYDDTILEPDVEATTHNFALVTADAINRIETLHRQDFIEISLFGVSMGTILACSVGAKTSYVNKVILNLSCADTAKTVWSWDDTRYDYFKKILVEKHFCMKKVQKAFSTLHPKNNLQGLSKKKVLLYTAEDDDLIPYEQQEELKNLLQKHKITHHVVHTTNLSHVLSGGLNLVRFPIYLRFLS